MTACIDHLVVTGDTLEQASAHVAVRLGLAMSAGGAHAAMGTHNQLLSLGQRDYLEALAIDPGAPSPARARWFGLDTRTGPPRLAGWALRVDDLDAALADAPDDAGRPLAVERGNYRWRISVPATGLLPFDGLFPALIEWQGAMPAPDLPDLGGRLVRLTLTHPRAGALGWALSMLTNDDRLVVSEGPVGLAAVIHTPTGARELA